jgi:plastocyanin
MAPWPLSGLRLTSCRSRTVLVTLVAASVVLLASAGSSGGDALRVPAGPLPVTITAPPPEHRADASLKTYVQRAGPYDIGPYETLRPTDNVPPPPVSGSIVGMDVRIVDTQGAVIPQQVLMLHHSVFTNGGEDGERHDGACPRRAVNERFYGTSEELRALSLPRGYGYPTSPLDHWKLIWMVMNHTSRPAEFYLEYRVTVDPRPLTPVKPYWVSVVPCVSDPQYTVPGTGAAVHRRSKLFRVPVSGRIVAIGGHLHGGATALALRRQRCGNRMLARSSPTYAPRGDPLYQIRPLLHEPDPKSISWWQSSTGWSVKRGERLRVTAVYENRRPHMRVMGIAHVYIASELQGRSDCAPPPADAEVLGPAFHGGRSAPPVVRLTLARLFRDGRARGVSRPPGRTIVSRGNVNVAVAGFGVHPANLSIPLGARVRWTFRDRMQHDVTLATGPRGFASPYSARNASWERRFTVAGEYRLYCSLHPALMSQLVRVRHTR